MGIGFDMTGYDIVIATIFVFFMVRGIWVGLLGQVTVIIALYVGYLVSGQYHDKLFPFLRGVSENPQVVFLLACAILFVCTYVLTMLLGKALTGVVQLTIAGWFDKLLGALFGGGKALILAILLHMLLSTFLAVDSPMLHRCQLCPYLSSAMTLFQGMIKDEKLRQAFQKKGPAIPDRIVAPGAAPRIPLSTSAKQVPGQKESAEKPLARSLPAVQ